MKKRHNFTSTQKVSILRRHLLKNEPVSDICDDVRIHPTLYYRWQKIFFEKGGDAFNVKTKAPTRAKDKKIEELEAKLSTRNELVSELLVDNLELKIKFGDN